MGSQYLYGDDQRFFADLNEEDLLEDDDDFEYPDEVAVELSHGGVTKIGDTPETRIVAMGVVMDGLIPFLRIDTIGEHSYMFPLHALVKIRETYKDEQGDDEPVNAATPAGLYEVDENE